MPPLQNTLSIAFILTTTFGLLMHDTRLDHATKIAITTPIAGTSYAASEVSIKSSDHTHVEKVSVSSQQMGALRMNAPRTPVRDDDDRYIQLKKASYSGDDGISLWPSV